MDRISTSQQCYENIGGNWMLVSRTWHYPVEKKGEKLLLSENQQMITGLGGKPADQLPVEAALAGAYQNSVLVSRTQSKTPKVLRAELISYRFTKLIS